MNVTTTFLRPAPPPTTNNLDARQRVRLIRSARKLGAVLGTTPQLAEPLLATPAMPAPARLPIGAQPSTLYRTASPAPSTSSTPPSLYASSANSSAASLALETPRTSTESLAGPKVRPRRAKPLPRQLVLRLHAVPVAHSDPRVCITPPTPTTAAAPMSPTTPVDPMSAQACRRRMAKLQRTLGENVPPELVFPAPRAPARGVQARPPSPAAPARARSSQVWVTQQPSYTGEWNRKDIREVQQRLRELRA